MNKDNFKFYTYQLDMGILNILVIILFLVIVIIMGIVGYDFSGIVNYNMIILFILLIFWLMLHEVLHGIGFAIFKEVKLDNIVFGMALEKGVFYCMCKQKISKKVIFTSLLFPLTIIGIVTLLLGLIFNNLLLVYLSIFNIVGSVGDIVMSVYFFKCPSDVIYLDLDDCTSFTVLSKNNLDNIRIPGIKLVSSGVYDSKMKAKDKRKLVISKASWYILIIIFILILVNVLGGVL